MATRSTQRAYRAPCPGCGAEVEFRSAQSAYAVCPYCQSTVVRSGEVLQRVGRMAELFDDHSPLQLHATGRLPGSGEAFTLIGRMQLQGEQGRWTQWLALLDDGRSATLSEDNGAYVLMHPAHWQGAPPPPDRMPLGSTWKIGGGTFSVAANLQAQLLAAEGELPALPPLGEPFPVVELRSSDGEVLSIDFGAQPPEVQRGRSVELHELQFKGLRDGEAVREEAGRQFDCPHCGAPVQVQLDASKSCTCPSCRSLIDLTRGLGAELSYVTQQETIRPLIPLGSIGQFEGVSWQVVGFQHRTGVEPGDDEHFGWEEYLLYHRQRGFVFLVDASDGWSLVRPTSGAPAWREGTQTATYLGRRYRLTSTYLAETNYVAGEFYWPVYRGQKSSNSDFAAVDGKGILSREQTPGEVTWSHGQRIDSTLVAQAFKLGDRAGLFRRQDAGPVGAITGGPGWATIVLTLVLLVVVLSLMSNCSGSPGGSYRSTGGSWGGYTSGGGHK